MNSFNDDAQVYHKCITNGYLTGAELLRDLRIGILGDVVHDKPQHI